MWESPIDIICNDIQYKVVDEYEKQILEAIQSYGISVNKKELVKALNYDRNQYEQGYKEGYREAIENIREKLKEIGFEFNYLDSLIPET